MCITESHCSAAELNATLKAMAPHSSTPAWKIPWREEPGRLQSMGLLRVGHDWETSLSLFTITFLLSCIGEGNGNPLQCSCLENPRKGEPGGLPLWVRTESTPVWLRTQLKRLSSSSSRLATLQYNYLEKNKCVHSSPHSLFLSFWLLPFVFSAENAGSPPASPQSILYYQTLFCIGV